MKKFKLIYYIWAILILVIVALSLFVETSTEMISIMVILLFGGAALFRSWKKSLVEVVVEENAVHLTVMDGKKRSIIPEGIVVIRETNNGIVIRLKDASEYRAKKGKCVIRTAEGDFNEFRPEDFPYAEFRKMK